MGLVVEMLQEGSDMLLEIIADVSSEILKPDPKPPSMWKECRVRVLLKKGDPKLPDNYRPITLMKILYKLFSRMLLDRIRGVLASEQPVEQACFREGYRVGDHLFAMTLIIEGSAEFNVPMWVCTVDFRKIFDTVEHEALWAALRQQGVGSAYVRTLAALYEDQTGQIWADETNIAYVV